MVGYDHAKRVVGNARPQPFAVICLADRRADLSSGIAIGDVLGTNSEVVRTGFDTDTHPVLDGRCDHWQGVGA